MSFLQASFTLKQTNQQSQQPVLHQEQRYGHKRSEHHHVQSLIGAKHSQEALYESSSLAASDGQNHTSYIRVCCTVIQQTKILLKLEYSRNTYHMESHNDKQKLVQEECEQLIGVHKKQLWMHFPDLKKGLEPILCPSTTVESLGTPAED